jgi:uncharacterized protein YecT (DUF1311 family)
MRQSASIVALSVALLLGGPFAAGGQKHALDTMSLAATLVATTGKLSVPILKEDFTVLSCSKNSTLGLEGCAEHHILSIDTTINSLRRRIFQLLYDAPARRHFIAAEHDWFKYRQANCLSDSDVNQGGSLVPVDFAQCVVRLDQRHRDDLLALLALYHPDESG